jgi:hypothetical protein
MAARILKASLISLGISLALLFLVLCLTLLHVPKPFILYTKSGSLASYPIYALVPGEYLYSLAPLGFGSASTGVLVFSAFIQSWAFIALVIFWFKKGQPSNNSFKADTKPLRGSVRP